MLQSIYLGSGYQEQPGGPYNHDKYVRLMAAEQAIQRGMPPFISICTWNNETGRTAEEVVAKLREVAAKVGTEAPMAT